jgi:hypothetical protein
MNETLLIFIGCTFANVVISTIKSVMTIKGGKFAAAFWNALSYGLYSYIVILTASASISTLDKVLVTIGCNLIGVFGVKLVEEKMRKDRLWKFEITVPKDYTSNMINDLQFEHIPFNYIENIGKYTIFNVYSANQKQSTIIKQFAEACHGKAFASETTLAP